MYIVHCTLYAHSYGKVFKLIEMLHPLLKYSFTWGPHNYESTIYVLKDILVADAWGDNITCQKQRRCTRVRISVWSLELSHSQQWKLYLLLVIAHVNRHQRHQIGWLVSKSKGFIKKLQRSSTFVVMIVLILQQYQQYECYQYWCVLEFSIWKQFNDNKMRRYLPCSSI